jgi:S1-C subfamily serine protease
MLKTAEALLLSAGVCACASYTKPLPSLAPRNEAGSAETFKTFKFSERARVARLTTIVFDLPTGYSLGEFASGNSGCHNQRQSVNTGGSFKLDIAKYRDVFSGIMKNHGYPVDDQVELFQDSKERVADLQVGARVIEVTLNECFPNMIQNNLRAIGNAYLKIEWSVYSTIEKKVVFVTDTEGSTYTEIESAIGEPGILRPAMADAVERLASDAKYREIVDPPTVIRVATGPRIKIRATKAFIGDLKNNIEGIRKSVVTVTANKGTGSGFIISEDGTVVTVEHVVSGSKFVKVNTAAGKECYGEVAAVSKQRDLAIIRLDCGGLTPLPVARAKIVEGREVFAVGTPLSEALEFSVTKGVVSGMRKFNELDYIQSDVSVFPGSSGGPLLDSSGNVVGVTSGGIGARGAPVGVNFFIPLLDIEKYLPVDFE